MMTMKIVDGVATKALYKNLTANKHIHKYLNIHHMHTTYMYLNIHI
jgi:hypothetical protein